jgi:hypothetical protein
MKLTTKNAHLPTPWYPILMKPLPWNTRNLQEKVKFYCLNTGWILKQQSFTPYLIPDWIIKNVNSIEGKKTEGRVLCFLNWQAELYEWTVGSPKDDPEFQGLLEDDEAPYQDIIAEFPLVELESEVAEFTVLSTNDPEPDFCNLATMALNNAGMNPDNRLWAAKDHTKDTNAGNNTY